MTRLLIALLLCGLVPVPVFGQAITRLASQQAAGTIAANGEAVTLPVPAGVGFGGIGVEARGTWVGTIAVQCAASTGGGTFLALTLAPRDGSAVVTSFTANGQWAGSVAGCQRIQAIATAWTSGVATITLVGSFGGGGSGSSGAPVGTQTVAGLFTHDTDTSASIGARNITTLGFIANVSAPTFTEGRVGYGSTDLTGNIRVTTGGSQYGVNTAAFTGTANFGSIGAIANAAAPAWTEGRGVPTSVDLLGNTRTITPDPCSLAKTHIPINIVTATTTELTAALAGASNFYYICSIDLVTAGANNVALVDDDTDGCGSVTSGLAGGITAATGWNLAANGGLTKGNGAGTVFKTGGLNRVVCLMTSAAVQLSGSIGVVAAP